MSFYLQRKKTYRKQYYSLKRIPYKPYRTTNQSNLISILKPGVAIVIVGLLAVFLTSKLFQSNVKKKPSEPKQQTVLGLTSSVPSLGNIKPVQPPKRKENTADPRIPAKSIILLDGQTSYPLYTQNASAPVPIASTTKIMTSLIVLENYDLNKVVTVSRQAAYIPGSKMNLRPNEKITVGDLLWGLLMVSGNDAAYALAEQIPGANPGDFKQFTDKMNEKASSLGLLDTKFKDPAGLDDTGLSSAHDLAFLTAYALKNKTFIEIVSTGEKTIASQDGLVQHQLKNSNRLVVNSEALYYQPAIGVKTGFTEAAGHCLVAAAKQNDHLLISVVLNTNNTSKEESARLSRILLDWGFNSYTW